MAITPYKWQEKDAETLRENNFTGLLAIEAGGGKGHPLDEPVLTPTGWTPVGKLKVGDEVVGSDGKPTAVMAVYDRGVLPVYRVTFRDGSSVRVDSDHLWQLHYRGTRGRENTMVVDTAHLLSLPHETRGKYYTPTTGVDFPEASLPLHPYLMGVLLADGSLHGSGVQWTKNIGPVTDKMERLSREGGFSLTKSTRSEGAQQWGISGITGVLSDMGLRVKSADKFIPQRYLVASREQRIELVHGLFDGDGSVRKERGTARYSTTSSKLADDVLQLLWSLGAGATKSYKKHHRGGWWVVTVHHSDFSPFGVSGNTALTSKRTLRRSIRSIEPAGVEEVRCIRVSAKDHLYVTKDFIVTHNTVTACMAIRDLQPAVTLIIAPDSTINNPDKGWPNTLREFNGIEMRRIGNGKKAEREALDDFRWGYPGVYATTHQFFGRSSTDISLWHGDLLIVDEAHKLASPKKTGQRRLSGWYVKDDPLAAQFPHRLALSGTPMRQNFQNMWATMRLLWPWLNKRGQVAYSNFVMWASDRMDWVMATTSQKDQFGNRKKVKKFLHEKEPGKLWSEMPCVIQHKRRERCCDAHPNGFLTTEAPTVIRREVELTINQKRAIREMEKHMMTFLDDNPLVVEIPLTQKQRIRQLCLGEGYVEDFRVFDKRKGEEVDKQTVRYEDDCASPFIEELIDILRNEVDEGEPVVVYLEAQRFVEVVTYRLRKAGFTAEEYSGVRKADLNRFGEDYQVLVGVVSAIGTGTDGLGAISLTEVWMEVPVSITDQQQAEARLDRMGSRGQVLRYVITDSEGVAEGRLSANIEKRLMVNASTRAR